MRQATRRVERSVQRRSRSQSCHPDHFLQCSRFRQAHRRRCGKILRRIKSIAGVPRPSPRSGRKANHRRRPISGMDRTRPARNPRSRRCESLDAEPNAPAPSFAARRQPEVKRSGFSGPRIIRPPEFRRDDGNTRRPAYITGSGDERCTHPGCFRSTENPGKSLVRGSES